MAAGKSILFGPVILVTGFILGIIFSAWKLDYHQSGVPTVPHDQSGIEKADDDVQGRIVGIERMLAVDPKNKDAWVQLGNDCFDTGNFVKASESYEKALEIDPKNPDVLTDLAISYRRLGKTEESVKFFRKALEIDPAHTLSLFNLGLVLRDDFHDDKGALDAWESFLNKAGDSPHAVMVRPWVTKLRDKLASDKPTSEKDSKK